MEKIAWVTIDNHLDHSFSIRDIAKQFEIDWYVILSRNSFFSQEDIVEQIRDSQINLNIIYHRKKNASPLTFFLWWRLIFTIKRSKPDIIYINLLGMPYFSFLAKILLPTSKIIYCIHDVKVHCSNAGIISQYYINFINKNFLNFRLHSVSQKKIFEQRYKRKNILIAPLSMLNFGYAEAKPSSDQVTFLFFGRDRKRKGLKYLVEAGKILEQKYKSKFKIVIAGNLEDLKNEESLLLKNYSSFTIDNRAIPNSEIPFYFLTAHYLVLPYLDVTQSGPLHIAYRYNLPVIASNLEGFREFVDNGRTGFLFESQNSADLARVMSNAIENHSEIYSNIKSELGQYFNQSLSDEQISKKMIAFFNKI